MFNGFPMPFDVKNKSNKKYGVSDKIPVSSIWPSINLLVSSRSNAYLSVNTFAPFAIKNGAFYIASGSGSTLTVKGYDKYTFLQISSVTITGGNINSMSYIGKFVDGGDGWYFKASADGTSAYIFKVSYAGVVQWSQLITGNNYSNPVYFDDNGNVYSSGGTTIVKCNPSTGSIISTFTASTTGSFGAVRFYGGYLYVSNGTTLEKRDMSTGNVISSIANYFASGPSRNFFISSDGYCYEPSLSYLYKRTLTALTKIFTYYLNDSNTPDMPTFIRSNGDLWLIGASSIARITNSGVEIYKDFVQQGYYGITTGVYDPALEQWIGLGFYYSGATTAAICKFYDTLIINS